MQRIGQKLQVLKLQNSFLKVKKDPRRDDRKKKIREKEKKEIKQTQETKNMLKNTCLLWI